MKNIVISSVLSIATIGSSVALPLTASAQGKGKKAAPAEAKPVAAPTTPAPVGVKADELMFKSLRARSIGPGIMGGRVSSISYDLTSPSTFYVALGTGGLMKTNDNGATFSGVFEKEAVAAIGAVAVAPSDGKIVWVGTGEANDRNSSSWGNGVYLSTDGGDSWNNVGLRDSKTIARIAVHPTDPNTAYVAAMGDLWRWGGERGLYKTTDGGKTWKAVLQGAAPYADRLGCGDVAIDPSDPNTVYAALYARQRLPWAFVSGPDATDGKDVGGIFKSTDGGATWKKLETGMAPRTGRIGLAVFKKDPKTVMAIVQSDEGGTKPIDEVTSKSGGVFRSEDGGATWKRASDLNPRPFYFSQIRIDPDNSQRVYVLGFGLHVSDDGGKTFREDMGKGIHSDLHELAIDPRNPKHLLVGSDGGVYQSYTAAKGWDHLNRMAAGEYYRVAVDMSQPYRVAGGLQDNLNWVGPSAVRSQDGILNESWINIDGGDGFYCVFDPDDPNVVYAESQQGFVHRFNLKNGEARQLRPEPAEGQAAFRFHWNSPLIGSAHAKDTLYLGGNRVFKLTGKGELWKVISPDLSARDAEKAMTTGSGAENYGVVYSLAESPVKAGMLWAGTDDGKLWVTDNEGGNWTDLSANLPAAVKGQWINRIEPSHFDAQVAYLVVDAHRVAGYAPLVYRTADGGKTWQDIASNLPKDGPAKVIREDLKNPNLLFVGTEFGLFMSLDRGANWVKFGGLPTVAVDDLVIHPREMDLVIATHGRSLYIVDDIRPLQEMTPENAAKEVTFAAPRPAFGSIPLPGWKEYGGTAVFRGDNPPFGAIFNVVVKSYSGDPIRISVTNAAGQTVANLSAPGVPGLNRVTWDLKLTKDLLSEYRSEGAKFVQSGEYTVNMTCGKIKQSQKIQITIADGLPTWGSVGKENR
jgi:photosystem II stability/assembly factor-like uncharacterized protein